MAIDLKRLREFKEQNTDFALRNITQIRAFHQHLITASLVAIGSLITANAQGAVQTKILAAFGGLLLLGAVLLSTIYLTKILSGENNKLAEMRAMLQTIEDGKGEEQDSARSTEEWRAIHDRSSLGHKDDYLDWVTHCFVLGVVLAALAFV